MTDKVIINGFCDDRFKAVKEVFAKNFEDGLDVGASFAATIDGKYVIDIWAGYADVAKTRSWERDTIINVYSTTKVMTVLCTLMCVDRGLLDLEAPVAKYWPEFAQAGKEKILIRNILSHTSGLSGFGKIVRAKTLYNWDRIIKILAEQEPWWEPGTQSGYHAITHGYLLGELVRRVTGKTVGTFFREEVAIPLNADFHIGLSEEHDHRVAELISPDLTEMDYLKDLGPIAVKTLFNPVLNPKKARDRAWLGAEIPAANGQGNARSVARVASLLACGGQVDDIRLLSLKTIEKSIEEQIYGMDLVLNDTIRFGLGWGLTSKEMPISPNPRTFYWGGWGGSVVVMDLDAKLSFAFVMNNMMMSITGDPRTTKLGEALYKSL
jgi:CubicO group peptidase (beta-lactamase class C family)